MEAKRLDGMIDQLRFQLVELAMKKGNFLDREVIELSQQLDKLIVQYQQLCENNLQESKVSA